MKSGPLPRAHVDWIEIDGLPVHTLTIGEGRPIVLLHGWGGEIASFGPIPSILADRFRIVALDLPGFGQTPLPRQPWGTFEYGDCVASLLRRSGLPACTLVGHSFGGRVAIAVAARSPELVGKLVLVDSAGIVPRRSPSYYVRVSMVKLARTVLSLPGLGRLRPRVMAALHRRVGSSDYRALVDPIQRAIFVRVVNEDVRHLLPRVPVPTLLIWGDQDRETPLADGRLMERLIPDAGLVVFEGAGHFSYLERLDQFCRVLAHFAGSP